MFIRHLFSSIYSQSVSLYVREVHLNEDKDTKQLGFHQIFYQLFYKNFKWWCWCSFVEKVKKEGVGDMLVVVYQLLRRGVLLLHREVHHRIIYFPPFHSDDEYIHERVYTLLYTRASIISQNADNPCTISIPHPM